MEKLLIVAALACHPGDRPIDLSSKLPRGLQYMDFIVSVQPFYARLYIYQLGYPRKRSFTKCTTAYPQHWPIKCGGFAKANHLAESRECAHGARCKFSFSIFCTG
jgi:hypothetical protein